jgi:hypothetical protein
MILQNWGALKRKKGRHTQEKDQRKEKKYPPNYKDEGRFFFYDKGDFLRTV